MPMLMITAQTMRSARRLMIPPFHPSLSRRPNFLATGESRVPGAGEHGDVRPFLRRPLRENRDESAARLRLAVVVLGGASTPSVDEPRSVRVEVRMFEKGDDATVPWAIGRDPHERLVAPDDVATHVAHLRLHAEPRSDAAVAVDADDIRPTARARAVRAIPAVPRPNPADYGALAAQTTYTPS